MLFKPEVLYHRIGHDCLNTGYQFVHINTVIQALKVLKLAQGVPQGSVLGLLLFIFVWVETLKYLS